MTIPVMEMTDDDFMARAIRLALRAQGKTSPNPLVGAVLVKNNHIVSEGWHRRCGGDHAEIVAIRKAGASAQGATLYVTLEPCFHYGRTPPCVDKIIDSGIREVVIGRKDPNPLTKGKSIAKLRRSGIEIKMGFKQKELDRMNEAYLKYITEKMPFVVAKCAQTLDGKIATGTGQSKWITSLEARRFARQLRNDFDAIAVGINTVLRDNPGLNAADRGKRIKKIIVDTSLRVTHNAKLFKGTRAGDCFVATTQRADQAKINLLKKKGINVIICPERGGLVNLRWLFHELARKEIASILIEGGSSLIGQALKGKLVDKLHIYIAPLLLGDQRALNSITGLKTPRLSRAIRLKNMSLKQIGKDIFIQAYV
ncbi:MAG: bifunctional diaminohydroxyphosphoribosylaminopyrimidine deaminase/5-amino-6-(5-phosphoribosylamino)uracil reductase RibD [Candidatus Omnitrophota bacterium]